MTNRPPTITLERPPPADAPDDPSPTSDATHATHATQATHATRNAARIAGVALLLTAATSAAGNLIAVQGLVSPGDAAATARDIAASEGLFRLGVSALYLAVIGDVVVAWALMRVFSPVSRDLSRLAAWFRLAYAAVFMVSLGFLAGIPRLLDTSGYAEVFTAGQREGQALLKVDTFTDVWFAGLILFGVHLALLGLLAYRSGFVPRLIGVLLVVAGAGYAFDSFISVFSEGSPFPVSSLTFVGELLLALWLLFRGHRISLPGGSHAH
jgi:hypothetical protein